jgi:hypothetical protein
MTISQYCQWQAGIVAAARQTENDKVGAAAAAAILVGADDAAMLSLTAEQWAAVEQANHGFATTGAHYGRTAAAQVHGNDPGDILPAHRVPLSGGR